MTLRRSPFPAPRLGWLLALVWVGMAGAGSLGAQAQPKGATPPPSRPASVAPEGPRWNQLNAAQREALKPLREAWDTLDAPRKRKWLEIAQRFPSLGEDERRRVHERMVDWVSLSAQQRTLARINYRSAKEVPASQRLDRWESYQSLSPQERKALADQARRGGASTPKASAPRGTPAAAPVPVSATTKQARPGATTVPVTQRPQPTWHQQPGLPKIATSPRLIDPHTLLPVAGPQGAAATRPSPTRTPRPTSP